MRTRWGLNGCKRVIKTLDRKIFGFQFISHCNYNTLGVIYYKVHWGKESNPFHFIGQHKFIVKFPAKDVVAPVENGG